jgi:hypothetical protein
MKYNFLTGTKTRERIGLISHLPLAGCSVKVVLQGNAPKVFHHQGKAVVVTLKAIGLDYSRYI